MTTTILKPTFYAPPPPTHDSPQPAVIIGVGEFGVNIVKELRTRQALHTRFEVMFGDWFDRFVFDVELYGPELMTGCVIGIREAFLQDEYVSELSHHLRKAFRDCRRHENQPWSDFVLPRLIVIGATWEPSGCALLWPVAALLRMSIGEVTPYELLGLFVSAGYHADHGAQTVEDAHTFATLQEGDCLMPGQASPPWYQQLAKVMGEPDADMINRELYDHIFLVDALKENNATSLANDRLDEVGSMIGSVLEALLFTPSYTLLDQSLLDDYPADDQQVYVGAGVSALTVPLREIEQMLREQTIAHLIHERLLVPLRPDRRQDLQNLADRTYQVPAIGQLREWAMSEGNNEQPNDFKQLVAEIENPGVQVANESENYKLSYHLSAAFKGPNRIGLKLGWRARSLFGRNALSRLGPVAEILPDLGSLHISGPNPFSSELSLAHVEVLARLDDERGTVIQVLDRVDEVLSEAAAYESAVTVYEEVYARRLGKLLSSGESGLKQALEILERSYERWSEGAEKLQALAENVDESPEIQRLRDAVEPGERRSRFEAWLKYPLQLKPRFSSLFLRGLALVAVLFQFYWSAVIREIYPPPLQALGRFSFPGIMGQPWWEWLLLGFWIAVILVVILFLYGLPTLALRGHLLFHRRSMARLVRMELERRFIEYAGLQVLAMAEGLEIFLGHVTSLGDELAAKAAQFAQNNGEEMPNRDYLEWKVVKPSDIVKKRQVAEIARKSAEQHEGSILDGWLRPDPIGPLDLVSAEEVEQVLKARIQPITTDVTKKPVGDYLHEDDHTGWFHYMWQGAVPWLKRSNGERQTEAPPTCNVLLLSDGHDSPFAWTAEHDSGHCHIAPWPDPYRILLLRLQGGISSGQLARNIEWRQAFQQLPEDKRQSIALAPSLITNFPRTLAEALPGEAITGEQESIIDIVIAFEDAMLALMDEGQADEAHQMGLDLALEPLRHYPDDRQEPDLKALEAALVPLDESWEQLPPEINTGLAQARRLLDDQLIARGLEPVRPPTDEPYDPELHGMVVDTEPGDLPKGYIAHVACRGYRSARTNQWLREPRVIVSSGRPSPSSGDEGGAGL